MAFDIRDFTYINEIRQFQLFCSLIHISDPLDFIILKCSVLQMIVKLIIPVTAE